MIDNNYESSIDPDEYEVGDIVETKKQHPCGSKNWEITRVGVDFKLKCTGCGHVIMIEREKAMILMNRNPTLDNSLVS